jgi:putative hydrolase of the HAD superfamily
MIDADVVVFDWYNTLAAPHPDDFWTQLPDLIVGAGGVPDPAALREWAAEHPVEHREFSSSEAVYRAWQRERFERLLERSGVGTDARTRLAGEVEERRYTRLFDVFDDVVEAVVALRHTGRPVGLCSNWDWDLDRHLRHNRVDDLFDFVVCSAIHGHRKPHPAIFDTVTELAGVPAERIVFVGDDLHDDIQGATTAGLRAVHLDRDRSCGPRSHPRPVHCVTDLPSVVALLG